MGPASKATLAAADAKYQHKMHKHNQAHKNAEIIFIPFVMEHHGAFQHSALQELTVLTQLCSRYSHPPHNSYTLTDNLQYWAAVLSIAVTRATARRLLAVKQAATDLIKTQQAREAALPSGPPPSLPL